MAKQSLSPAAQKLYEWADLMIDFLAALMFFIGSICFFFDGATKTVGVWLFVFGSALFGLKPALKNFRGIVYGIEHQMHVRGK